MKLEAGKTKYALAIASNYEQETVHHAVPWTLQRHIKEARLAGAAGVEFWPGRLFPTLQIRTGIGIDRYVADGIYSAHQSVAKPLSGIHTKREALQAVAFPEKQNSLRDLLAVHKHVGDVPTVLFETKPKEDLDTYPFSIKGIQPQPELCELWNVDTAEEFVHIMKRKGFTHVVPDTHHLRRRSVKGSENPLKDWEKSLPTLLDHAVEIHVGIARADSQGADKEQALREAQNIVWGAGKETELVRMLRFIKDIGWKGLVVIETRPGTIARQVMNYPKRFVSIDVLRDMNKRIIHNVRNILGQ